MKVWLMLAGAILVGWIVMIQGTKERNFDDQATVSVFPDKDSVKNYELTGSVSSLRKADSLFTTKTIYTLSRVDWPNGGYSSFGDCAFEKLNTLYECTTDDNRTYYVKVTSYSPPETDYDPNY